MAGVLGGDYKEPAGSNMPEGDHLVMLTECKYVTAKTKGTPQLQGVFECEAGSITDFIAMTASSIFRAKQLIASLSGKSAKDVPGAEWDRLDTAFGDITSEVGATKLAKWMVKQGRPVFITVKGEPDQKGVMRARVGVFNDEGIRPCPDELIDTYKPLVKTVTGEVEAEAEFKL